ncbi:MAG: ABC transporter substrate-binding protein [Armatimonadota bacterium]
MLFSSACNKPAEQKASKVRIAFFPNITHAAALHAASTGVFQQAVGNAVQVEERVFTAGPAEIEALFAGEVDFGYIGPGPAINGYIKSNGQALEIVDVAASGGASLIAAKGQSIKSVNDLKGKRVAVPQTGGTQDVSLRHALKAAGLEGKDKGGDVDIVQYAPADTLDLFRRGELDAAWLPEPWVSRIIKDAGATLVTDERTLWAGGKFATAVVIVRKDFAKANPDVVAKLIKAHRASVDAINADKKSAGDVISKQIAKLSQGKTLSPDLLSASLSRTDISYEGLDESILTFADWAKELGYLKKGRDGIGGLIQHANQ